MTGYTRTAILMAFLTALFMFIGAAMGGKQGMLLAFGFAALTNFFAYWNADKLVLRHYRAKLVDAASAPNYYHMVRQLAENANLPMPKLYIIENEQPNAFATGRNPENAAVAATTGLMKMLTTDELAGVMAHELAHVKHRDTLIMTVTATLAGALSMLANFALFMGGGRDRRMNPLVLILVSLLAPLAASIVQMAISRSREYEADRLGADICRNPKALADALYKISGAAKSIPNYAAEQNPATAHLFIINPLHVHTIDGLFSTHPSTQERIRRLLAMTQQNQDPSNPWSMLS